MIIGEKGCFGSPFSHVLRFHNSFLYISNFMDILIKSENKKIFEKTEKSARTIRLESVLNGRNGVK